MSFLIDPPLLYASGRAYGELTRDSAHRAHDTALGAATMATFWGVSVSMYLERPWTQPLWLLCRASSGRDWMLNSGLLRIDWRSAGTATHIVSAAVFLTYPYWLWRGVRAGRRRA